MKRFKIYLAAPLFSVGERAFNKRLVNALEKRISKVSFMLPQEYASTVNEGEDFVDKVFRYCITEIKKADVVLCILDGADVDSGTCIEMGYAYAYKKPIIGVRTDFRGSEDRGVNIMVSKVCGEMVWLPDSHMMESKVIGAVATALKHVLSDRDSTRITKKPNRY